MDDKSVVKRTLLQLRKEFGNILSVNDILQGSDVAEENVLTALDDLKKDGLITWLDDDSIQVNAQ